MSRTVNLLLLKKYALYLVLILLGNRPLDVNGQRRVNLPKGQHLYERIDSLLVFDPRTYISIKSGENEYVHCPSLSDPVHDSILLSAQQYFDDTTEIFSPNKFRKEPIPIGFTYYDDNLDQQVIDSVYQFLSQLIQKPSSIRRTPAPEFFTSLLSGSSYRYGMLIFQYGHLKSDALYKKQMVEAAILGLLTRGLAPDVSEFRAELHLCIIDSKTREIIFFGSHVSQKNILETSTFTEQFHYILDWKLRKKKRNR